MKWTRNKGSKRLIARRRSGKFAKTPSVEKMFGFKVMVCPVCRGINTFVGPVPDEHTCHHDGCGAVVSRGAWQ